MASEKDDTNGYGKPPTDYQFKKGKSGNPKGRPKGSKSLRTLVLEGMDRPVLVTKGGVQKSMHFRRALADKVLKDAFNGDPRARAEILKLDDQVGADSESRRDHYLKKSTKAEIQLQEEVLSFMPLNLIGVLSLARQLESVIRENIVELRRLRALSDSSRGRDLN